MKKQIILMIGIMLILGFTMGVISNVGIVNYFNSIEDAKDYVNNYLKNRESIKNTFDSDEQERVDKLKLNYTYISDKTCEFDYNFYEFVCSICYDYNYEGVNILDCVNLPENTTREQDDILVEKSIRNRFKEDYIDEEIKVNLRNEKDRKF